MRIRHRPNRTTKAANTSAIDASQEFIPRRFSWLTLGFIVLLPAMMAFPVFAGVGVAQTAGRGSSSFVDVVGTGFTASRSAISEIVATSDWVMQILVGILLALYAIVYAESRVPIRELRKIGALGVLVGALIWLWPTFAILNVLSPGPNEPDIGHVVADVVVGLVGAILGAELGRFQESLGNEVSRLTQRLADIQAEQRAYSHAKLRSPASRAWTITGWTVIPQMLPAAVILCWSWGSWSVAIAAFAVTAFFFTLPLSQFLLDRVVERGPSRVTVWLNVLPSLVFIISAWMFVVAAAFQSRLVPLGWSLGAAVIVAEATLLVAWGPWRRIWYEPPLSDGWSLAGSLTEMRIARLPNEHLRLTRIRAKAQALIAERTDKVGR